MVTPITDKKFGVFGVNGDKIFLDGMGRILTPEWQKYVLDNSISRGSVVRASWDDTGTVTNMVLLDEKPIMMKPGGTSAPVPDKTTKVPPKQEKKEAPPQTPPKKEEAAPPASASQPPQQEKAQAQTAAENAQGEARLAENQEYLKTLAAEKRKAELLKQVPPLEKDVVDKAHKAGFTNIGDESEQPHPITPDTSGSVAPEAPGTGFTEILQDMKVQNALKKLTVPERQRFEELVKWGIATVGLAKGTSIKDAMEIGLSAAIYVDSVSERLLLKDVA